MNAQDLLDTLKKIMKATDPYDPESYRCDDSEGALDYVFSQASAAVNRAEHP